MYPSWRNKGSGNIKDTLVLIKNGKFYNAYKDDAIIMSYLFGYKINKDNKCAFPEKCL